MSVWRVNKVVTEPLDWLSFPRLDDRVAGSNLSIFSAMLVGLVTTVVR